jgi:hypothetical protein
VWRALLAEAVDGLVEGAEEEELRGLRAALRAAVERVDVLLERASKARR